MRVNLYILINNNSPNHLDDNGEPIYQVKTIIFLS